MSTVEFPSLLERIVLEKEGEDEEEEDNYSEEEGEAEGEDAAKEDILDRFRAGAFAGWLGQYATESSDQPLSQLRKKRPDDVMPARDKAAQAYLFGVTDYLVRELLGLARYAGKRRAAAAGTITDASDPVATQASEIVASSAPRITSWDVTNGALCDPELRRLFSDRLAQPAFPMRVDRLIETRSQADLDATCMQLLVRTLPPLLAPKRPASAKANGGSSSSKKAKHKHDQGHANGNGN